MKIYTEQGATIRYYYLLKFKGRIKTVCLDVRRENAKPPYVEGKIKESSFGKDAISVHFDDKFTFQNRL
jgi:hypothetical protein